MEEIRTFKRGGASVRAVMVEGEPMVLFRDLSALCGYAANTGSARYYCAEPPTYVPVDNEYGSQTMRVVGEADAYRLVTSPAKKYAEERRSAGLWLFCEVFPEMRRLHAAGEAPDADAMDEPAGFVRHAPAQEPLSMAETECPPPSAAAEPPCPDAARVLICKLRNAARESGNSVRANALADALAVMDGAA
nr:MAG TPA: antirepressor [Caudoviricetes sp.]